MVLNKVLSDSGKRLNDGVSFHPLWVTVEKEATKDLKPLEDSTRARQGFEREVYSIGYMLHEWPTLKNSSTKLMANRQCFPISDQGSHGLVTRLGQAYIRMLWGPNTHFSP